MFKVCFLPLILRSVPLSKNGNSCRPSTIVVLVAPILKSLLRSSAELSALLNTLGQRAMAQRYFCLAHRGELGIPTAMLTNLAGVFRGRTPNSAVQEFGVRSR